MAYHPDIRHSQTSDLKQAGNVLYIVGMTTNTLAGSHAAMVAGLPSGAAWQLPRVDLALAPRLMAQLHQAIQAGLTVACHDISDGGLAVAAAEMALAGRLGLHIDLDAVPSSSDDAFVRLFSESPSRFLVEVPFAHHAAFSALLADIPHAAIGQVNDSMQLTVMAHGQICIDSTVATLVTQFNTAIV
jgi:phosphoribosylformylglycinamidine synthase